MRPAMINHVLREVDSMKPPRSFFFALQTFVLTVSASVTVTAMTASRVALVVGNGPYAYMPPPAGGSGATIATAVQDPSAVEAALSLGRPTRWLIHQGLHRESLDPEVPDGLFGPRTQVTQAVNSPPLAVPGGTGVVQATGSPSGEASDEVLPLPASTTVEPSVPVVVGSPVAPAENTPATLAAGTVQLPPEILIDRHLAQAQRLLAANSHQAARDVIDEIIALQREHDVALPAAFPLQLAQVAFTAGLAGTAVEYVTEYLLAAGRQGEFYRDALELLVSAEEAVQRADAERPQAVAARQRAVADDILISRVPLADAVFDLAPLRDLNRFALGSISDRNVLMEAHIAGDVRIKRWGSPLELIQGERRWMVQVYGTGLFRLRMLNGPGSPVRPPSFMPKATINFVNYGESDRGDRVSLNILSVVPYGHHSNGQSQCPVVLMGDMACTNSVSAVPPPINLETGDFSTNYMTFGYYRKDVHYLPSGRAGHTVIYGGDYEQHVSFIPGGLHKAIEDRYGKRRLNFMFGLGLESSISPVRIQANMRVGHIFGVEDGWIYSPELVYYLGRSGLGVYGRLHWGRDYYNINFENTLFRMDYGLTFSWDRLDRGGIF